MRKDHRKNETFSEHSLPPNLELNPTKLLTRKVQKFVSARCVHLTRIFILYTKETARTEAGARFYMGHNCGEVTANATRNGAARANM